MEEKAVPSIPPLIPIGHIKTCFKTKNGTPRQPTVSASTRGYLKIEKSMFTNPDHSLEGLEEFSHVWLLFHFHLNTNKGIKAKVRPPRLDGVKKGVFATRSPHRPNAIGLTLAKLEKVENQTVHLSMLDVVDGTPIIDMKPYISQYDCPHPRNISNIVECDALPSNEKELDKDEVKTTNITHQIISSETNFCTYEGTQANQDTGSAPKSKPWTESLSIPEIQVIFTTRAERDLQNFSKLEDDNAHGPAVDEFFPNVGTLRQSITDILSADPRSIYRRNKCSDR